MCTTLRGYLAGLTFGRLILWWYFIWYLVVLVRYFDPTPQLWLTAVGLSVIIGTALLINTTASGSRRVHLEPWPAVRLYLFPFCVSSFSSLVKGRDFILVFSLQWLDLVIALGLCGLFSLVVAAVKTRDGEAPGPSVSPDPGPCQTSRGTPLV